MSQRKNSIKKRAKKNSPDVKMFVAIENEMQIRICDEIQMYRDFNFASKKYKMGFLDGLSLALRLTRNLDIPK